MDVSLFLICWKADYPQGGMREDRWGQGVSKLTPYCDPLGLTRQVAALNDYQVIAKIERLTPSPGGALSLP